MSNFNDFIRDRLFFRGKEKAQPDRIESAETELGLTFSAEYKEYLSEFGYAATDDNEFTGICPAKRLGVVFITQSERESNPGIPPDWYVVEQLNIDGIVIWQNALGEVFQTVIGSEPKKLCNSLYDYVNQSES
jgi:hypothetical protein